MKCEKKSFSSKEEAAKRISEIQSKCIDSKKPIRSYRCEKCGNFHLTSWSRNAKNAIVRKKAAKVIKRHESEADYWQKRKGW